MWSIGTAVAAPVTISCEWLGDDTPSPITTDTSMGVDPAHIVSRPPPLSRTAMWQNFAVDLVNLTYTTGTVIDVSLDIVLFDGVGNGSLTKVGTLAASNFGVKYLDGVLNTTAGELAPSGYLYTLAS